MTYKGLKTGGYTKKAHLPAMLISVQELGVGESVGSTPRKGQNYGETAGCNKAWNDKTANKKEPDMDK